MSVRPDFEKVVQSVFARIRKEDLLEMAKESITYGSAIPNEKNFTEYLFNKMREFGFEAELYDFDENRPNLVGFLRGKGEGPNLGFFGHTDTMPPTEPKATLTPVINNEPWTTSHGTWTGEKLWGRGSCDMKSGMVAVLIAMKAIREAGIRLDGDIVFSATGDEETGLSAGVQAISHRMANGEVTKPDFGIWVDPSDNMNIYITNWGYHSGTLKVKGRSVYPGTPEKGINAISLATKCVQGLLEYSERISSKISHEHAGSPFVLVWNINGGKPVLSVPDEAVVKFWRILVPGEDPETTKNELEEIFASVKKANPQMEYETEYDPRTGIPSEASADSEGIQVLKKSILKITDGNLGNGLKLQVTGAPYWGEISYLNNIAHVPTVFCGPGIVEVCHTGNEWIETEWILKAAKIYALTALKFCGIE